MASEKEIKEAFEEAHQRLREQIEEINQEE